MWYAAEYGKCLIMPPQLAAAAQMTQLLASTRGSGAWAGRMLHAMPCQMTRKVMGCFCSLLLLHPAQATSCVRQAELTMMIGQALATTGMQLGTPML